MSPWQQSWRLTVFSFVLLIAAPGHAEDDDVTNVLQLGNAKIEDASVAGDELEGLAALVDGDAATVTDVAAEDDAPLTIVYGFGGETVAIEQLTITLPPESGNAKLPARVDVLASTLSPHAGFQSVRTDPLRAIATAQEFPLRPTGAKWIMLRFTPGPGATQVAIAEVGLIGRAGPPVTHYRFKESPAKAFDVLRRLEKSSAIKTTLSADERGLFEDARDGKLDTWSFDDAALLASGVAEATKRQDYLKRLDEIEADVRRTIGGLDKAFEQGRALLEVLHAGPMAKGYESRQTDVSTILDDGTFNCVSSATLFNLIGRRLGLDCRAIEVPQHAFSIVYDGLAHADVETTTPGGFNPERDEAAREEFTKLTGFAYIPDSNRDQRREVGDVGLIAIIYYNHGVMLSDEKRFHEALMAYFRAMSLDPESDSSVKNALAVLANWSLELAEKEKFEDALNVLGTGLDLAPEDAALRHNRLAVWNDWAETLMKAGKNDEALTLLQEAARQVPDGDFLRRQSWVFIRQGEEHVDRGEWVQALALVEPGLLKLEGEARGELEEWGANLYHRWAQSEQELGHFAQALNVVERALAAKSDDGQLINHLAYLVQEWLREAQAKEGAAEAERRLAELLERFGKHEDVRDVAEAYAHRTVKELAEGGRSDEALAAAERLGDLLKNPELALELARSVYDQLVDAHRKRDQWQAAIHVYAQALERFPGDEHLENNLAATWSQWAQSYLDKRNWAGALEVYDNQRKQGSDGSGAENNIRYGLQEWVQAEYDESAAEAAEKVLAEQLPRFADVENVADVAIGYFQRIVRELADKAKYDEALAAAKRARELLKDEEAASELVDVVYDTWAESFVEQMDWQAAIDVYAKGLASFPDDDHLEQNAVATWNQWAQVFMDKEDWPGAVEVYEKALKQFPDNGLLQNNLKYCQVKNAKSP